MRTPIVLLTAYFLIMRLFVYKPCLKNARRSVIPGQTGKQTQTTRRTVESASLAGICRRFCTAPGRILIAHCHWSVEEGA